MDRGPALKTIILLAVLALGGCAGDHLAPVSDRSISDGGQRVAKGHYEVRSGDTLYAIAWEHGLDHRDLAEWNRLDSPDRLRVGQQLRLEPPSRGASERSPESDSAPPQQASAEVAGGGDQASDHHTAAGEANGEAPGEWRWPTDGEVVKTFSRDADGKQGINISGEAGQPVVAVADGEVVYSGSGLVGYGNLVILKHGGEFLTAYGYNRSLMVAEGDSVRVGDRIAEMGTAVGGNGTRLHFELRRDGRAVDPLEYLPDSP